LYYFSFSAAIPEVLKADLLIIKPTFFVSVPRLYNRFHDAIKAKFAALTGIKKFIMEAGVNAKLDNLKKNADYTHKLYDKLVFNKVKDGLFGGCVKFMLTGSAPLSKDVCDFLKIVGCCPLLEGYGQTESTGASFVTVTMDPLAGHVGGPTMNTEFKLEDVPEMNYTSEDKDSQGNSVPRGEVLIRGHGVMKEYYKAEDKTAETIVDGWLHTGDIA